ncbi:MAG: nucleotidyltransferase domain-containing protein [Bacteroidales bacterium]|jgi:predicted nucleotidyltransferase|nr:nucleotidyltransferase domain-containing protein [Bacteroidales bacterium]MDD4215037.1 nucleotidyltransferase domain-containing protein [Bacteroidales bacterium]
MATAIAQKLKNEDFGVKAVYLIGSSKNASSGPASDIDLMIHIDSREEQKILLEKWIEGWSHCLASVNDMLTGHYDAKGLIDLHIITDDDIKSKTSYAVKIGAHTDPARKLL